MTQLRAHKAKTTHRWLWRHVPAFIRAEDWPSGSPVLNPLDYKLWAVFGRHDLSKASQQLDSLKRSLVKTARGFPLETVRAAIEECPERLKACAEAQCGHFERHYYK